MADSEEVSVRIGSNKWKVGDDIRIVGSKVVNKEKLQSVFGVQWKTAQLNSICKQKSLNYTQTVRNKCNNE